jgi:hypothetical protein
VSRVSALTRLEAAVAVDHARQARTDSGQAAAKLAAVRTRAEQHSARLSREIAVVSRG